MAKKTRSNSPKSKPTDQRGPTRRDFVTGSVALGVGTFATYALGSDRLAVAGSGDPVFDVAEAAKRAVRVGEPAANFPVSGTAWSKRLGSVEQDVVIDTSVILDVDARVRSLTITETGRLTLDPLASITLTSAGNVSVFGTLVTQPRTASQVHKIHFDSVDESKFVGGGMKILQTDVGLWISGQGRLRAKGSSKAPWTRASGSLTAGSKKITVASTRGWRAGDQITIVPTGAPSPDNGKFLQDSDSSHEYDDRTITSIEGNNVSLDRALTHDHPMMSFEGWDNTQKSYGAEVLNLTRNVIVSGTDAGKAHVLFLHCEQPQQMSDVHFDQLGPRQFIPGQGTKRDAGVAGRYPVHMHHCGDDSRGTVIKGCLVTRSGNRAFVPHESHGITLDSCVAHDVHGSAFWWDQGGRHHDADPVTHDAVWKRCVASYVWASSISENNYRLAGFYLSKGNDDSNKLIDSVAVGVTGSRIGMNNAKRSGFHWPESGASLWKFRGCLAHNIGGSGTLSWQNDESVHRLTNFTAYHCGAFGIEHGAYSNLYAYTRLNLVGNRLAGIGCHAVTRRTNSVRSHWAKRGEPAPTLLFKNVRIDGQGLTTDGVRGLEHRFPSSDDGVTLLENVVIQGVTRAGLFEESGSNASYYHLKNFRAYGVKAVVFEKGAPAKTKVKTENLNGDGSTNSLKP